MKLRKIIVIVITIFTIFYIPNCYAASENFTTIKVAKKSTIPSDNASAAKISKYIQKNGTSGVSISTLCKWYNTVGSSDTVSVSKIDSELKSKSANEIKSYCSSKTSSDLKSSVPSGVLSSWEGKVTDSDTKNKLGEANEKVKKESEDKKTESNIYYSTISPSDFEPSTDLYSDEKAMKKAGKIIAAIQGFGSVVSLGVLVYIGIRYMLGSIEEKAMYKETMLPYIIGAILVFAGTNIVGALYNAFN